MPPQTTGSAPGMTQYTPHPYIMRLKAELRALRPGWPDLENAERLTRAFVAATSHADLFQIRAARLALRRSNTPGVRQLAQTLLEERRQIAQRLQSTLKVAAMDGQEVLIPYQLDARHEEILNQLCQTADQDFGATYIREQADAHAEAVRIFQFYGMCGEQPAVRAFACLTLSCLESRLEEVQKLI